MVFFALLSTVYYGKKITIFKQLVIVTKQAPLFYTMLHTKNVVMMDRSGQLASAKLFILYSIFALWPWHFLASLGLTFFDPIWPLISTVARYELSIFGSILVATCNLPRSLLRHILMAFRFLVTLCFSSDLTVNLDFTLDQDLNGIFNRRKIHCGTTMKEL